MPRILAHAKGQVFIPGYGLKRMGDPPRRHYRDPEIEKMAQDADDLGLTMTLTLLPAASAASMLAVITTTGLFMSIHTASPGTTGANEIVGGTGYTGTRPAVTWAAASLGIVLSSNTQTFALLVTQAGGIPNYGLWTANTAGTYLTGGTTSGLSGSIPSGANVTFTSSLTLTVSG